MKVDPIKWILKKWIPRKLENESGSQKVDPKKIRGRKWIPEKWIPRKLENESGSQKVDPMRIRGKSGSHEEVW